MRRMSFKNAHPERSTTPMHKLIADIGFMGKLKSTEGATCYLGAVDEATRMTFMTLMERKGDATDALITMVTKLNIKYPQHQVKIVSTDDDKMFHNAKVADVLKNGPHATTPLRICMNSSLKQPPPVKKSLNDCLMKGPPALVDLFTITNAFLTTFLRSDREGPKKAKMAGKKEAKQKAGPSGQTEKNREEIESSKRTKNTPMNICFVHFWNSMVKSTINNMGVSCYFWMGSTRKDT